MLNFVSSLLMALLEEIKVLLVDDKRDKEEVDEEGSLANVGT